MSSGSSSAEAFVRRRSIIRAAGPNSRRPFLDPAEIIPILLFASIGSFALFGLLLYCIYTKLPHGIFGTKFDKLKEKKKSSVFEKITEEQVNAAKTALALPMVEETSGSQKRVFNLDIAKLW